MSRPAPEKKNEDAPEAFQVLIGYIGLSIFNQLRDQADQSVANEDEGAGVEIDPGVFGDNPSIAVDVRPEGIDFRVGEDGPYHLAMKQAIELLPPEERK